MTPFKLRLLVKTSSKISNCSEFKYIIEGDEGVIVFGKKISSKNTKLSSLINLIQSDSL